MKLRIVGVIAAIFLGGAWATAQAPMAPPPGTPVPSSPLSGASGGVIYGAASPQFTTAPPADVAGPLLPAEAFNGSACGHHFWASADYLLWRIRSEQVPDVTLTAPAGVMLTLQTTSTTFTAPSTTPATTTSVLMSPVFLQAGGNTNSINVGDHNGGRISAGYWFDPDQLCGIDGSFFFLERRGGTFTNATGFNQNQNLIDTGLASTVTIITPGTAVIPTTQTVQGPFPLLLLASTNSHITASTTNQMFGGELNTASTCLKIGSFSFGGFVGFRYFNFNEDMDVGDQASLNLSQSTSGTTTVVVGGAAVPVTNLFGPNTNQILALTTTDSIRTRNNFYGGQVGADVEVVCGDFFVNLRGKIGLGDMHEVADISGSTSFNNNGVVTTMPGGLLSGIGDIGSHKRDRIAYIGEVNLKLGYEVCRWLRLYVGYDGLGVSNVARPELQTAISTTNLTATVAGTTTQVTVSQPTFHFSDASIWAQGIDFGFELRY